MKDHRNSKLEHDFFNSIVSIKTMSQAANHFIVKIAPHLLEESDITPRQIEIFKQSMQAIEDSAKKAEDIFIKLTEKNV